MMRVASMKLIAYSLCSSRPGDRQDVGIEDDVGRIEAGAVDEQPVGALADRHLALDGVGIGFVERHHHDARAEAG